jgi:hypothetical protein
MKPALYLVVTRIPVPVRPSPANPGYLLAYCSETLECGHSFAFYPDADPLIAKRRACPKCNAQFKEAA